MSECLLLLSSSTDGHMNGWRRHSLLHLFTFIFCSFLFLFLFLFVFCNPLSTKHWDFNALDVQQSSDAACPYTHRDVHVWISVCFCLCCNFQSHLTHMTFAIRIFNIQYSIFYSAFNMIECYSALFISCFIVFYLLLFWLFLVFLRYLL